MLAYLSQVLNLCPKIEVPKRYSCEKRIQRAPKFWCKNMFAPIRYDLSSLSTSQWLVFSRVLLELGDTPLRKSQQIFSPFVDNESNGLRHRTVGRGNRKSLTYACPPYVGHKLRYFNRQWLKTSTNTENILRLNSRGSQVYPWFFLYRPGMFG